MPTEGCLRSHVQYAGEFHVVYVRNVKQMQRHQRYVHSRKNDDDDYGRDRRASAWAFCISLVLNAMGVSATVRGLSMAHVVGHSDHGQPLVDCPNCGPIIVVSRTRGDGDDVFCRNCGGLARLHRKGDGFEAVPMDAVADPGMMRPSPEIDVLNQFIDTMPRARSSFFLGRISAMVTGRGWER